MNAISKLLRRNARAGEASIEVIAAERRKFKIQLIPTIPAAILIMAVLVAILAPWLAPHSPTKNSLSDSMMPPAWIDGGSSQFLLGTDLFGRDQVSRLVYGARVSLSVSFAVLGLVSMVGVGLGLLAGFIGGIVDGLIMRVVDIILSFPPLLIAIVLAVVFGSSFGYVVLIIALFYWTIIARQVRGETLALKTQDFVTMARITGASNRRIMFKHILPNALPTILVITTLQVGTVILFEASLSFLGVGIPPPQPSWGVMVSDGRGQLATAWWLSLFPGLAIVLVVLAANSFGDWLRDHFDPRLKHL